jgi:ribosomal protein S18 acetylase RimI-like enzyme
MTIGLWDRLAEWYGRLLHPPMWMVKSMCDVSLQVTETEKKIAGRWERGWLVSAYFGKWRKSIGSVWVTNGRFENEDFTYGVVYSLWVNASMRRLGIGELLMHEAVHLAVQAGKQELFLVCRPNNKGAVKFYNNIGFKPYSDSAKAVFYENELSIYWPRLVLGFYYPIEAI